jgi:mono/diheme cytochrome c family protein
MSSLKHGCAVAVVVWTTLTAAIASRAAEPEGKLVIPAGDAARGKPLYRRYCVGCHGPKGDGQGENAPWLDPRPRDFTAATFKCRSTPTGSLPLDLDLFATILRGVYASGMPSWGALMPQERADLLAYIKSFSPRFHEEKLEPALQIPSEPLDNAESVARGNQIYQRMECFKCHGKDGSGNGPSATTLTDNKERPIVPYDFTTGTRFKCGQTNEDLYRIFMTGLDGTPMPSFHDQLQPAEAWDLVHYLRTLQVRVRK